MKLRCEIGAAVVCLAMAHSLHGQTCTSVSLSASAAFAAVGGGNGTFTATGTPSNCNKTAVSNAPWISISFGGGTANPSTFGYTVQANNSVNQRTGSITVNGGLATFTITQPGITCSYSLTPGNLTAPASGASGSFTVTTSAECTWTAISTAPWIQASGSGPGNGSVNYVVETNSSKEARTGTITAGGVSFTVNQQPACSFTLSPPFQQIRATSDTGSITITANASSCSRAAVSDSAWLTIPVGASGTGNGTLSWNAAANTTPNPRTGRITVGDAVFTLQQEAGACTYALNPTSQALTAFGGGGSFNIVTTCQWEARSTVNWLSITGPSTGTGNGSVLFRADPNIEPVSRTGSITVGSTAFLVTQEGTPCDLTLSSNAAEFGASGGPGSFDIRAANACRWTAVSSVPWITFSSAASGSGEGTIAFAVAANPTPGSRTGTITVGNRQFVITQRGANCELSISPTSASIPAGAFQGMIEVTSTCQWSALPSAAFISITGGASGTGSGIISYSVGANPSAQPRTGSIRIGNLTFNLSQSGAGCTLSLNPVEASHGGAPVSGRFNVTGSQGCQWTPTTADAWITISGFSSVNGTGAVDYALAANLTGATRTGTIRVGSETFTIRQEAARPAILSNGILNGASFRAGPIAPGEIITIYGTLMGPAQIKTLELTPDRLGFTTQLAGTRVLIDGQPCPMIYTTEQQLSAIVPFEVSNKTSVKVQVEYMGAASDEVEVAVAPTAPAMFTQSANGTGLGAILNQDNGLNTASSAAPRNSIVQIFATGGGQTSPPGQTGRLAGSPLPQFPAGRVTVRINNIDAPVVYAGAAPGLIQGLIQINARIPANAPIGAAVPIVVRINNVDSPAGVTVAIRQ
jgi:uncharacterized protein (TIGR03437 family)